MSLTGNDEIQTLALAPRSQSNQHTEKILINSAVFVEMLIRSGPPETGGAADFCRFTLSKRWRVNVKGTRINCTHVLFFLCLNSSMTVLLKSSKDMHEWLQAGRGRGHREPVLPGNKISTYWNYWRFSEEQMVPSISGNGAV